MTGALDNAGIAWRAVLDTPSGAAVRTCVDAGLGISVVDPWQLSAQMKVLEGLPRLPEHEIVVIHASQAPDLAPQAIALLTTALQERFRL